MNCHCCHICIPFPGCKVMDTFWGGMSRLNCAWTSFGCLQNHLFSTLNIENNSWDIPMWEECWCVKVLSESLEGESEEGNMKFDISLRFKLCSLLWFLILFFILDEEIPATFYGYFAINPCIHNTRTDCRNGRSEQHWYFFIPSCIVAVHCFGWEKWNQTGKFTPLNIFPVNLCSSFMLYLRLSASSSQTTILTRSCLGEFSGCLFLSDSGFEMLQFTLRQNGSASFQSSFQKVTCLPFILNYTTGTSWVNGWKMPLRRRISMFWVSFKKKHHSTLYFPQMCGVRFRFMRESVLGSSWDWVPWSFFSCLMFEKRVRVLLFLITAKLASAQTTQQFKL